MQPAAGAGRSRQAGQRFPGRPLVRSAGGAGQRAEPRLPRPLPERARRPFRSCSCAQPTPGHHPALRCSTAWRSSAARLYRRGKAGRSPKPSAAQAGEGERASPKLRIRDDTALPPSSATIPAKPACATWSGSWAPSAAKRRHAQQTDVAHRRQRKRLRGTIWARRPSRGCTQQTDEIGVVNGLAWTSVGGELLEVEAGVMDGSGKLELTGNLGEVMQESVTGGLHLHAQPRAELGIPRISIRRRISMSTSRRARSPRTARPPASPSPRPCSALTGAPVRHDVAMTGEVTLRGRVLPIGGLREKTMAAKRSGIRTVIIPKENERIWRRSSRPCGGAAVRMTAETVDAVFAHALTLPKKEAAVEHLAVMADRRCRRCVMAINFNKAEFVLSAVKAETFIRDGKPAGHVRRAQQRGQILRYQPAAGPEEFRPRGRYPRQDQPDQLLRHRREDTSPTCPATAMPRSPRRSATAGAA